jgi:hypothetical protein
MDMDVRQEEAFKTRSTRKCCLISRKIILFIEKSCGRIRVGKISLKNVEPPSKESMGVCGSAH